MTRIRSLKPSPGPGRRGHRGATQPKVSAMLAGLVRFLAALGHDIEIAVNLRSAVRPNFA